VLGFVGRSRTDLCGHSGPRLFAASNGFPESKRAPPSSRGSFPSNPSDLSLSAPQRCSALEPWAASRLRGTAVQYSVASWVDLPPSSPSSRQDLLFLQRIHEIFSMAKAQLVEGVRRQLILQRCSSQASSSFTPCGSSVERTVAYSGTSAQIRTEANAREVPRGTRSPFARSAPGGVWGLRAAISNAPRTATPTTQKGRSGSDRWTGEVDPVRRG
jgi:hypothetical protein